MQKTKGNHAKECPSRRPSCLCCKAMDHEVLDCPRMIAKLERMNMDQVDPEKGQEIETLAKP